MIDYNMPFDAYLAHPSYGSSDVKAFRQGPPAMVPWRRKSRTDSTPATRLGSAAHCHLLTPHLFDEAYAVRPDDERGDFRTKVGKAWRDDVEARGLVTLSRDDFLTVQGAADAVRRKLGSTVKFLHEESSVFWDSDCGLPCKGRPDWFDSHAVYDLKVSIVADKPAYSQQFAIYGNGWLHQLGHNRAGLAANGHAVKVGRLVVVSPNAPHNVYLLEVREGDMDFLELDNENTRRGMMVCHRSGIWPGTPDTWQTVELPASAAFTESDLEGAEENPIV